MIQRQRAEKKRKGKGRIAAVLTAAALVTALTVQTGLASDAVDPLVVNEDGTVQGGTITVLPMDVLELPEGALYDIYQIAEAEELSGQDAYSFAFKYADGESFYNKNIRDAADPSAETLNAFAQVLAGGAKTGAVSPATEKPMKVGTAAEVEAGMYLIILHGEDKDYWDTADGDKIISTMRVDDGQYVFAPIVVSLPNRKLPEQEKWETETITYENTEIKSGAAAAKTSDRTPWDYDIVIKAKAGFKDDAAGSLKITKTLKNHEHMEGRNDKVTFVYRIEAVKKGEPVYSGVESIVLENGKLQGSAVVNNIPVGAEVTVTEVYFGGNYGPDGPAAVSVTIKPDEVAEASFVNKHNGGYNGGGSVKNTYGAAKDKAGTGWSWNNTPAQEYANETPTGTSKGGAAK